jgi:hypothetical protein
MIGARVAVVLVLVLAYGTAVAWCFRSELHRFLAAARRRRRGLPWRLAWRKWRLRKAPVPRDGGALDLIDEGRWAMVLRGYGDKAGTAAVTDAELEAEALMGDTEAGS